MENNPRHLYRRLLLNHEEMGRTVLQVVRHPDATAEDLMKAREVYRACTERVRNAYTLMIKKYGMYAGISPPEGIKR